MTNETTPVEIYTDGACSGNPGPGGWAAIIIDGDDAEQLSGGESHTTNNRMELMGAIQGLENVDAGTAVTLYTDSAYVSRAFNEGWIKNWKKNGWKTSSKKPVKNRKLWERLSALNDDRNVDWVWVKGHADNVLNNMADELAVSAMEKYK